jgi:type IV secretory pathway VirB2 component (pilin)
VIAIIAVLLSAIACGTTLLFALYRQFALVEVAASIAIGVELYFLSSSIGDALEDKDEPSRVRLVLRLCRL